MSRWFRFYADALRNPKVMRLSDKDFRLWVRLMAVASENDGSIPCMEDLKHILSMRLDHLSSGVDRLISGRLIDTLETGYEPHNWKKFQYKSDTSTERVTKHRAKRNVSETPPDTEADTDSSVAKATGTVVPIVDPEAVFWADAKSYLKSKAKGDPGALINKWMKGHGKDMTLAALNAAQVERAFDPIAYIEGYFRRQGALQLQPAVPL